MITGVGTDWAGSGYGGQKKRAGFGSEFPKRKNWAVPGYGEIALRGLISVALLLA